MRIRFFSRIYIKRAVSVSVIMTMMATAIGSGLLARSAAADTADRSSIALTPVLQRFDVKAGESATGELTVINDGSTPTTFLVYSRPYSVKNEQYDPDFETTSKNTDVYQWIRFQKSSFTLAPSERVDVPYSMQVPQTAAPGGHYGVIFVETQPPASTDGSVVRKKRIGSIILTNVDGKVSRQGHVASTNVVFWQTLPPLTVAARVENTGNTDFQSTTLLTVSDLFGNVKYRQSQDFTIYPGTIRKMTMSWQEAPWFGLFKTKQSITVLGKTSDSTQYVLLAPRWLPVTVLVLLMLGVGYEIVRRKRR